LNVFWRDALLAEKPNDDALAVLHPLKENHLFEYVIEINKNFSSEGVRSEKARGVTTTWQRPTHRLPTTRS
jgi:hypothetical protein